MSTDPAGAKAHESLSVIIVPSGVNGERLWEIVRRWYAAGLLGPAVWIRPEDFQARGLAPDVVGHYMSSSGDDATDLFEIVGRHRRKLVRVVLAQALADTMSVDELQIEVSGQVRKWIDESLPGTSTVSGGSTGTELRAINLITGVTGLAEMPSRLVLADWDVNAVTSPEDRPDPERANRFVRGDSNLMPLTLLSVAAVAGLFPGTDSGPFDSVTGDNSAVFGKALVVRPTVRALLGEATVEGLAVMAGNEALLSGSPALSEPARFVVGESGQIVESLIDWLETTDGGSLGPTSHMDNVSNRGRVVSIRTGLSTFVVFMARALVTMVWSLWRLILRSTEGMATKAIVGEASGIRLTLRPDVGEDLGGGVVALETEDIEQRTNEIAAIERRSVRMPTHQLWSDLREVCHGVLDGGSLPHGAPRHMEGSRTVLLSDPCAVVPRPDDHHVIGDGVIPGLKAATIRFCSPVDADFFEQHLMQALTQAEDSVVMAEGQLESLGSPPDDTSQRAAYDSELAIARRRAAEAHQLVDRLKAVESDFEEWLARRKDSLLWKLAERAFSRQRDVTTSEGAARARAVDGSGLDESAPTRLRRQFLVRSWLLVGLTALVLGGMNSGRLTGTSHDSWQETLTVLLVALAGLLLVIRSWYQGILRFLYAYESGVAARDRAIRDFEIANADRRRFDDVARQLGQWAEILGWSLHKPWDPPASATTVQATSFDESIWPAALVLAEPALDDVDKAEIARHAVQELTRTGWRGRSYRRLVARHLSERKQLDSDTVSAAIEAIDRDDGRGAQERQRFLTDLKAGRPQSRATEVVIDEAERFLRSARLYRESMQVRPVNGAGDPVPLEDVTFLLQALVPASPLARETWSHSALVEGAHEHLTTHYWTRHAPAWTVAERINAAAITDESIKETALLDLVVRIDVSAWLDAEDLRLFSKAPADQAPAEFPSAGSDESVFT